MPWWHSNWRAGRRKPASTPKRRDGTRPRQNDSVAPNGRAKPRQHWRVCALRRRPPQSRSNRARPPKGLPRKQFLHQVPRLPLTQVARKFNRVRRAGILPKRKAVPKAPLTSTARLKLRMSRVKAVWAERTSRLPAEWHKTRRLARDPAGAAVGAAETGGALAREPLPEPRSHLRARKSKTPPSRRLPSESLG